ncbi:MAG: gamma-glutamyltransferase [Pirellulaceae bacterium]|nr:gamma-glutamyltransferase [Pirellulaceae bacterium]
MYASHSKFRFAWMVLTLLGLPLNPLTADQPPQHHATSSRGVVATVHPLATDAGVNALKQGGNAVDAAIAAALTLGVVDPHNSGLGGGCFILIRRADGKLIAIDGRETAPARASREMYLRAGQPRPELSQSGALAVATPGALAAYDLALREHGRLKLAELALPAAEIAEQGFILDTHNAAILARAAESLHKHSPAGVPFLQPTGSPPAAGEKLQQPDLARTYRHIARGGTDWFYRGEFARAVGDWMAENGGLLAASDFAAYRPLLREPLITTYRGRTIVGFPPPSSGGVHVAQMLNILEQFDVRRIHDRDPAQFTHLLAETMKLAFADRAFWLGDPAFTRVPRGLVDKEYAKSLAAKIDLAKATPVGGHGTPPAADENVFAKHTTHLAAADSDGNWIALTQTINTSYGSKVVVPGTGVVLNNEMDDFAIAPGTPNAFGLVGAEANAVAAGKRPLSSMSPTLVLENGQPILSVGAAGGPTIITQVVQALVRTLDLGQSLDVALAAPRIHHQWSPDEVRVEKELAADQQSALAGRGHALKVIDKLGVSQGIALDPAARNFFGVHDPRVPGKAAGW